MWQIWTTWMGIIIAIIIGLVTYIQDLFNYWKKKSVPSITFAFPSKKKWIGDFYQKHYNWAKSLGYKHMGLFSFWVPVCMLLDPAIIKSILTKDFSYFSDRGMYHNKNDDPVGAILFVLEGQEWKNLRATLSPMFTSGKMKGMFQIFLDVSSDLKNAVEEICLSGQAVNVKQIAGYFTSDVIGSSTLGLSCNSFTNPNSEFIKYGHKMAKESNLWLLKSFLGFCYPNVAKLLKIKPLSEDVAKFFLNVTRDAVNYRDKFNVTRNDFLQLLINLKIDANNPDGFKVEEIAAQCFAFFFAGFETSASTLTFCLYELARNVDMQKKVREEINLVLGNEEGNITYTGLGEMKYMRQVIDEALRKYPLTPFLSRNCVTDFRIPDTNITIEERTLIFIPVIGLHHDPEYFPDPDKFDPERFNDQNKRKIIPYTYLPFGDGPRNCIGIRFAIMQIKVALVVLLRNFAFTLNSKTISPLQLDPTYFIASALGNVWLDVVKLET